MSGNKAAQALERGIFELFARRAGLEVIESSITQPDPPDILCEVVGLGWVGFELTAVDDPAALTRMALNGRTHEFWSQALANLSRATRARLQTEHKDVQVALEYAEPGTKDARRDGMRAVLERLAEQPVGYTGPLYNRVDQMEPDARAAAAQLAREHFHALPPGSAPSLYSLIDPPPPGIRWAEVQRFQSVTEGPVAFGVSVGGFEPIDPLRIDKKLGREDYRAEGRRELLAYVRWGDSATLEDRDFTSYLAQHIEGSPFARIWLFEPALGRVVAHCP